MKPVARLTLVGTLIVTALSLVLLSETRAREEEEGSKVKCANLVYAVNKSSVCFADRFLRRLELETNIRTDPKFVKTRLDSNDIYEYPFAIMTGEGSFNLTPKERIQLQHYVTSGGFLLASAGCSDPSWTRSFRKEMAQIFPKQKLTPIPVSHALYHTVYSINSVATTHDRKG